MQDAEKRRTKLKLLYLADLLRRETDEDHALSMSDILSRLEELGVHAERKSIYDDLRALEDYGMDIIATRGRAGGYQLAHREFELPELKLLVDAVQSSKFLSVKKSRELIRKLEGLASRWEAQSLQRQVYAVGRVKSMNESIYYSIDTIHTAISQDRQIAFRYFEWTMEKTVRYRRDGQLYERSPYALVWDDENYYLVAYDHTASPPGIRHYRVDKMANLSVLEESRLGKATFDGFDMAQYAKQMFGMFGGAQQDVELRFAARLAGVVLDRFGKGHTVARRRQLFRVHVQAVVSPQFMGWVAGFGTDWLLGPPAVVREYRLLPEMLAQYNKR
ncbi:MAG: helix-turn-helix transcriptional regulator [Ruthenibacterium lactatiformans]